MFFTTTLISILIATFTVGCLLAIRHPSQIWKNLGRIFIAASIAIFIGYFAWTHIPLDIFLISTLAGGFAWQEIIYVNILFRRRQKYFPHERLEENDVDMLV